MFERFTEPARRVLVLAQEEARLLGHSFIGTEHLLLGILRENAGVATEALAIFDIQLSAAREMVQETIGLSVTSASGSPPFTPRAKKVLELSLRAALQLGANDIGPEHLLLGLVDEGAGVAAQVLTNLGASPDAVRRRVVELLGEAQGGGLGDRLTHRPELPNELSGSGWISRAPSLWHQGRVVACSFCGRTPPASGQVIAGQDAFICEHCVRIWSRRLVSTGPFPGSQFRARRSPATGLADVRRGAQPDDPDVARRDIEDAYGRSNDLSDDGQSIPTVERGGNLGPTLVAARSAQPHYAVRNVEIVVDEVAFADPEHAAVLFSIALDGQVALGRRRGDAVIEDGVWKMARSTFCQLMGMAGVQCPPE